MPEPEARDFRPPTRRNPWGVRLLGALLVAALLALAWWWWRQGAAPQLPPAPQAGAPAGAATSAPEAPAASLPTAPPLPDEPIAELPALAVSDPLLLQQLSELLGATQVRQWLLTEGFVRRVVASVDNLGRAHAPASLWPVHPTPGRFSVQGAAGAQIIAPANAERYRPFVGFVEALPLERTVQLYARLYPLLQQAYEDLGFPGRSFNERLIAVIDLLLATPEPREPLAVQLTQVAGEVPSLRPWVRYEFADERLQQLASGQKMLLRVGPENAARLKTRLRALRTRLLR